MQSMEALLYELTSGLPKVSRAWRRQARHLTELHGISEACALPLITIGRLGDGARQITVADEIGLEGPSLVRLLDQLCAHDLLERRDDATDRRAKTLWLTPKGRKVTKLMEQELVVLRSQVLGGLPKSDIEAVLRVFQAFYDASAAQSEKSESRQELVQ